MAIRKNYINTALAVILISIVTIFVTDDVVLRITAGVMILLGCAKIVYEYLPTVSKEIISNIIFGVILLITFAISISHIFSTKNIVWHYVVVTYLIISIAAYFVKYIQINKTFSIKISNINPIDIFFWIVATVAVLVVGYHLFELERPFFRYKYGVQFRIPTALVIVSYLGFLIAYNKRYIKIGYISLAIGLTLIALMYFNVFSVIDSWVLFIIYLCTLVITVPTLLYVAVTDYPLIEGTTAVLFLLCIVKGTEVCAKLPEVWEHINKLIN